jgi:hypothetical protein
MSSIHEEPHPSQIQIEIVDPQPWALSTDPIISTRLPWWVMGSLILANNTFEDHFPALTSPVYGAPWFRLDQGAGSPEARDHAAFKSKSF